MPTVEENLQLWEDESQWQDVRNPYFMAEASSLRIAARAHRASTADANDPDRV